MFFQNYNTYIIFEQFSRLIQHARRKYVNFIFESATTRSLREQHNIDTLVHYNFEISNIFFTFQ